MKPDPARTKQIAPYHRIEIGPSTWDPKEESIRNRYENPTSGIFSPRGSSEVPFPDLVKMTIFAAEKNQFTHDELWLMIETLLASLKAKS